MDNQKLLYLTILHGWQCQWAIWSKSFAVIGDPAGKLNSRFLTFFDPVQEVVWSRVTKFLTVENVCDWVAKISRRQSNLRIHLQLFWSIMHIYREVKLKIGGMTKLNSNKHFLHFKCHAQEHNTLSWSGLDSSHTFQSACYWLDHFVALFTPM